MAAIAIILMFAEENMRNETIVCYAKVIKMIYCCLVKF
jgi:hypothetical protein